MIAVGLMIALFLNQTYQFMQFNSNSEVVIDVNTKQVNKVSN